MNTPDLLERMRLFFDDEGSPVPGWNGTEDEAIEVVTGRYPGRPYCTVREWSLLTIRVTDQELHKVRAMGFEPRVVMAKSVVTDSARRFESGSPVHTTMQRAYDPEGLFVTRNTSYVLLGDGRQKEIDLELYNFLLTSAKTGLTVGR